MSTEWYPVRQIPWNEFKEQADKIDGFQKLNEKGRFIRESHCLKYKEGGYIWCIQTETNGTEFEQFGINQKHDQDSNLIKDLGKHFNTVLVSLCGPYSDQWDWEKLACREYPSI